jgi:beta-carotene 15,15'-dioxygenase
MGPLEPSAFMIKTRGLQVPGLGLNLWPVNASGISPLLRTLRLCLLPLSLLFLVLLNIQTSVLSTGWATMLAAIAIVLVGIPHGTLDVEIAANRFGRNDAKGKATIIAAYLAAAFFMITAWIVAPAVALTSFLVISIIHFAADWQTKNEQFLGGMVGWALVALPALSHTDDVAAIFVTLTGNESGAVVAALLACAAVPAALGTLVYCYWSFSRGDHVNAVDVASCIAAAIFLPPLIAFMMFFCGLHSPRHMVGAWRETGSTLNWKTIIKMGAVFALSLGIGAALYTSVPNGGVESGLIRTAFILISVLTVPHFLLEHALRREPKA